MLNSNDSVKPNIEPYTVLSKGTKCFVYAISMFRVCQNLLALSYTVENS